MTVGKKLSLNFGGGMNTFYSDWNGAYSGSVGGSMTITAGAQTDLIVLDNLTVGKSATVNLGDSDSDNQALWIGTEELGGVSVLGSLKITGGSKKDDIELHRLYVGKSLTVQSGDGADVIEVNDSIVVGASLFDLGGGNDQLLLETVTSDQAGNLAAPASFGGLFKVKGGDGTDSVTLSADFDPTTYINFGSKLILQGARQRHLEHVGGQQLRRDRQRFRPGIVDRTGAAVTRRPGARPLNNVDGARTGTIA